eukprot:7800207-Alexandrium_andersonii.AAC.1
MAWLGRGGPGSSRRGVAQRWGLHSALRPWRGRAAGRIEEPLPARRAGVAAWRVDGGQPSKAGAQ